MGESLADGYPNSTPFLSTCSYASLRRSRREQAPVGISIRHFIFAPDGQMRRLSSEVINAVVHDRDTLPQYAGQEVRVATVILEMQGRAPIKVRVVVKGDEMTIDLSQVSKQVRGFYNSGITTDTYKFGAEWAPVEDVRWACAGI